MELAPIDAVDDADCYDTRDGSGDPTHDLGEECIGAKGQLAGQEQAYLGSAPTQDLEKASAEDEHKNEKKKGDHKLGNQRAPWNILGRQGAEHGRVEKRQKITEHM